MVNKNENSRLLNLCPWDVYFKLQNNDGDMKIVANGVRDVNNSEIIAQCFNNCILFTGTDGIGSHARIFIENSELRKEVGFENEEEKRKQDILTDEKCEYILNLKTTKAFEENIRKAVVCDHEKRKIIEYARKIKLNDADKIFFIEEHTGLKYKI